MKRRRGNLMAIGEAIFVAAWLPSFLVGPIAGLALYTLGILLASQRYDHVGGFGAAALGLPVALYAAHITHSFLQEAFFNLSAIHDQRRRWFQEGLTPRRRVLATTAHLAFAGGVPATALALVVGAVRLGADRAGPRGALIAAVVGVPLAAFVGLVIELAAGAVLFALVAVIRGRARWPGRAERLSSVGRSALR